MRKLLATLLVCAALTTACESKNQYGHCVGFFNSDSKKPEMHYEISLLNVFLAFLFSETVIVPIVVVGWELECPVPK